MYRVIIIDETVNEGGFPAMELHKNVEVAADIAAKIMEIIDEGY